MRRLLSLCMYGEISLGGVQGPYLTSRIDLQPMCNFLCNFPCIVIMLSLFYFADEARATPIKGGPTEQCRYRFLLNR